MTLQIALASGFGIAAFCLMLAVLFIFRLVRMIDNMEAGEADRIAAKSAGLFGFAVALVMFAWGVTTLAMCR